MPSLSLKRKMSVGSTEGEARKYQSEQIIENSWWSDIASQTAYLYDWCHDDNKTQLNNMNPTEDENKVPIDIKYIINSSQTMEKDPISYHIQLRPSQDCNVEYYDEFFKDRYNATFPVGLFIDIKDNKGKYNRWLVVAKANYNDTMFSTYDILRCDYIFNWIFDNKKYYCAGVLRSQNSYNSGEWLEYKFRSVEDQQKFIVPINRDTEQLYYNQRMLIDAKVLSEPRAWRISKINRIANYGTVNVTLAQDHFDQHKDYVELDDNGNIIGMWADYYKSAIEPTPNEEDVNKTNYSSITYSGVKPEMKIGGSYKKFTVNFYNKNNEIIDFQNGIWSYKMYTPPDGTKTDASDLLTILTSETSTDVEENQVKIKFNKDDTYIGNILVIGFTATETEIYSEVELELIAL